MPTRFVTNPRRNPSPTMTARVEQDRLSGGWSVYLHDGRRYMNMTGDAFSTEAAAKREAKALLAQARAGVPLETLVSMFWEKHYKPFAGHELDNPRRNPRKYDEGRDDAGFRKLSDLKRGEAFKRKADARKVYRKGDYDRSERKYACDDEDDISRSIYLKGDALVYVGFDY